jgi:glucose 1-dehydrogenase
MAAGHGHEYLNPDLHLSPEELTHIMIAMGRLGSPEDIASLAAFLVSDEAEWITGQTFHIDGGMH